MNEEDEWPHSDIELLLRRLEAMTLEEIIKYAKKEAKRLEDWAAWQEKEAWWEELQKQLAEESAQASDRACKNPNHQLKGVITMKASYENLLKKFRNEGMPPATAKQAARRVAGLIAVAKHGHKASPLLSPTEIYQARRGAPALPSSSSPISIWARRAAAMRR